MKSDSLSDSESDGDGPSEGRISVFEIELYGFVLYVKAEEVAGYRELGQKLHALLMLYLYDEIRPFGHY